MPFVTLLMIGVIIGFDWYRLNQKPEPIVIHNYIPKCVPDGR